MIHADEATSSTPRPITQFGQPLPHGQPQVLAQLPDVTSSPGRRPSRQARIDTAHQYGHTQPSGDSSDSDDDFSPGDPLAGRDSTDPQLDDLLDPPYSESKAASTKSTSSLNWIRREDAAHGPSGASGHEARSQLQSQLADPAERQKPSDARSNTMAADRTRSTLGPDLHGVAKGKSRASRSEPVEIPANHVAVGNSSETNLVDLVVKTVAVILAVILLLMAWKNLQQRPVADEVDRSLPTASPFDESVEFRVAQRSPVNQRPSLPAAGEPSGDNVPVVMDRPVFVDMETGVPQDSAAGADESQYPSTGYPSLSDRSQQDATVDADSPAGHNRSKAAVRHIPWPATSAPAKADQPTLADPRERPTDGLQAQAPVAATTTANPDRQPTLAAPVNPVPPPPTTAPQGPIRLDGTIQQFAR